MDLGHSPIWRDLWVWNEEEEETVTDELGLSEKDYEEKYQKFIVYENNE